MNLYAIHTPVGIYIVELESDQQASDHANSEDVYIGYDPIQKINDRWCYRYEDVWHLYDNQRMVENAYASFLEVKNYKENKEKS